MLNYERTHNDEILEQTIGYNKNKIFVTNLDNRSDISISCNDNDKTFIFSGQEDNDDEAFTLSNEHDNDEEIFPNIHEYDFLTLSNSQNDFVLNKDTHRLTDDTQDLYFYIIFKVFGEFYAERADLYNKKLKILTSIFCWNPHIILYTWLVSPHVKK